MSPYPPLSPLDYVLRSVALAATLALAVFLTLAVFPEPQVHAPLSAEDQQAEQIAEAVQETVKALVYYAQRESNGDFVWQVVAANNRLMIESNDFQSRRDVTNNFPRVREAVLDTPILPFDNNPRFPQ